MRHRTDRGTTGDVMGARLRRSGNLQGGGARNGGLWGLEHYRPINDSELRKAIEINEINQALLSADPVRALELNKALSMMGPVERAMIGKDQWHNIVVGEGLAMVLEVGIANEDTQDITWFVGLIKITAPTIVNADTLASHAGWTEAIVTTDYTGNRKAWVSNGVATGTTTKTISNSSSVASFAILTTFVASGAFLAAIDTGTAGILYAAGEYTGGDRSVQNGDTLEIQADFTATDDGV